MRMIFSLERLSVRVGFAGKGGSGKTALSSLLIRHLTAQRPPVVAIDADINRHLAEALGTDLDPPAMGARVKDWAFTRQTVEFHLKNARAWVKAATGQDLTPQVYPQFVMGPAPLTGGQAARP